MSLNDQIKSMPTQTNRVRMFKDGVKYKYLTGKDPITFKFLPAINPANADLRTSMLPFVTQNGELTDWGILLYQARFIGHGNGKFGTRQDVMCLRTFAKPGQEIFDPMEHLVKVVSQLSSDWGYLLKDASDQERPALSKPVAHFIGDIWDANQPSAGVQIGILAPSATTSLLDPRFGLAFQRANIPDDYIRQNYLLAYQVGDLTDPQLGPALESLKEKESQGSFSKYRVKLAQDGRGQVYRPLIGPDLLAQRHNFADPSSFLTMPTEEDIINTLIQLFNVRSPKGIHEYVLLKIAFPNHRIPEAPSAPGASTTIPAGFGSNPAPYTPPPQQAPQQYVQPQMAPTQPAQAQPVQAQPVTPVTMATAAPQAAPVPPQGVPVVPGDVASFDEQAFIKQLRSQMAPQNK